MEGTETNYSSNDENFFEEGMKPNEKHGIAETEIDSVPDENFDDPRFDPPSKICGGIVFSKLMSIGSKSHIKNSVQEEKKQAKKTKKKEQQQHPPTTDDHREEQDESASKLIVKLTNKIMKRKKELNTSNSKEVRVGRKDRQVEKMKSSFKPTIVMPTATTMSSLSDDSSPWVTDENMFDSFNTSEDKLFKNTDDRPVMGESTTKHTNKKIQKIERQQQKTSTTLQDLQKLLKDMKDLNGMVKENSTVLQAGIDDIALEISQRSKLVGEQGENKVSLKDQENPHRGDGGSGENGGQTNISEGEKLDIAVGSGSDADEEDIRSLRKERTYYKSEAETLRKEMDDVKEQLNEIRRILPQVSFNREAMYVGYQSSSDEDSWNKHRYQQTESTPTDFPVPAVSTYGSNRIIASHTSTTASISTTTSKYGGEEDSIGRSRQESYKVLETIENPGSNDVKLSFRSEIRDILSSHDRSIKPSIISDELNVTEATKHLALPKNTSSSMSNYNSDSVSSSNSTEEHRNDGTDFKRPPSSPRTDPTVLDIKVNTSNHRRQYRGRSISPMRKRINSPFNKSDPNTDHQRKDNSDEMHKKYGKEIEFAVAKSFYKRQWNNDNTSLDKNPAESSPEKSSFGGRTTPTAAATAKRTHGFLTADKKYRELKRSLNGSVTPKKEYSSSGYTNGGDMDCVAKTVQASPRSLRRRRHFQKRSLSMDSRSTNEVATSNEYCTAFQGLQVADGSTFQ